MNRVILLALPLASALMAAPALAQGWPQDQSMHSPGADPYGQRLRGDRQYDARPSRTVEVTAFRAADAGDLLGHGGIVIAAVPPEQAGDEADAKLPVYEAAVVDQLAGHGYQTAISDGGAGQVAEISISRGVVRPEEAPHKPVSGQMDVSVGNRGTATSLAIAVDLTKPKKAILSTRLDVRIRDKASGRVLWEGHAEGQARESEDGFDDGAMAARLAGSLFARFPEGTVVPPAG